MLAVLLAPALEPARAAGPLYPDLRPTPPSTLYFDRITIDGSSRYVLRFSNNVWNVGEGRLELQGNPNPNGSNAVYQNIYDQPAGGSRVSQTQIASDLLYHPSHFHYHLADFASYLLLMRNSDGSYAPTTADGTKTSFCIIDYVRLNASGPSAPRYTSCGGTLQGLSVGWGDTYVASLPEQWVDLGTTPLADGNYAIQSTVDPQNKLNEGGREGNNVATTYFHVRSGVIILGTSTSQPPSGLTGRVSNTGGASLNCRATPNGAIIARLPAGTVVQVTGGAQSGWVPVICGGQAGWVSGTYLQVSGSSTTPTPTAPPSGVIGVIMNTGGANLNCRATPNGTVVARLPAGSSVPVRGAVQNGWVPVTCASRDGWVSAAYLRIDDGTTTTPPENKTGTVVNVGSASLRCRVSPGGAIITSLPGGTIVEITGDIQNGWVPVVCGGRSGWVSAAYLQINTVPTPTPSPTATTEPTGEPPTATSIPPTDIPATQTSVPPTPTFTPVPPTATLIPTEPPAPSPTSTDIPTEPAPVTTELPPEPEGG
jgi:uncharacterized protein YgiM (DUF1202 family)